MVDPLSLVTTILTVGGLVRRAASTASQNKSKCLVLAQRVNNLANILPSFASAARNDKATAGALQRLNFALGQALLLIQSCQFGSVFSGKYSRSMAAELDDVDIAINNCIMELNLISHARSDNTTTRRNKATTGRNKATRSRNKVRAPKIRVYVDRSYYQTQFYYECQQPSYVEWVPASPTSYTAIYIPYDF